MIIDASAVVAIVFGAPDADRCAAALVDATSRRLSAGTLPRAYDLAADRGGPAAGALVDDFLTRFSVRIEPVSYVQALLARDAAARFGDGDGHPPRIPRDDAWAYALARLTREPLLAAGDRFAGTDVTLA